MEVLKSNRGFSLIEVLIGAAGIGVVALALMNLTNQHAKNQANVEAKFSGQELKQIITNLFFDKSACTNTLAGSAIGSEVNQIRNAAHESIYVKNQKYGSNNLIISSIRTLDKNQALTTTTRLVDLIVTFQKTKAITNNSNLAIVIPLKVTAAGPASPIVDCLTYDDKFVQKAGDVMSGALITTQLNATNNVTANGLVQAQRICTGGNCKTMNEFVISNQGCPAHQYVYAVNGTIACRAPTYTCPPGQVIRAISGGGVICVNLTPPGCPATAFTQSGDSCTVPAREHGQTGSCSTSAAGTCNRISHNDDGGGYGWKCAATNQFWQGFGATAENQCKASCRIPGVTISKICNKGIWQ